MNEGGNCKRRNDGSQIWHFIFWELNLKKLGVVFEELLNIHSCSCVNVKSV